VRTKFKILFWLPRRSNVVDFYLEEIIQKTCRNITLNFYSSQGCKDELQLRILKS